MNNNLKKKDIIKNLHQQIGFPLNYSKKIINDLIDIVIDNISKGDFIIKNIGSFRIINKKQRIGRNPKTRKEYIISSRKVISFKVSKKLQEEDI